MRDRLLGTIKARIENRIGSRCGEPENGPGLAQEDDQTRLGPSIRRWSHRTPSRSIQAQASRILRTCRHLSFRLGITMKTKRKSSWKVYVIDAETGNRSLLWSGLTKHEVALRWKLWNEKETRAILIAEPSWFPPKPVEEKIPQPIEARYDIYCIERDGRVLLVFEGFTKRKALNLIRWNDQDCALVMWPAGTTFPQSSTLVSIEMAKEAS